MPNTEQESKKTILLAHSYFGRGGAEVAIMWLIEALKKDFEIYLLTRGGINIKDLNKISGLDIKENEINLISTPPYLNNKLFGHSFFLRYCRKIAQNFDLRITGSRTIDWGWPAVHFLSDVAWTILLEKKYCNTEALWSPKKSISRKLLKILRTWIAGKSKRNIINDQYVANSKWTAEISRKYTRKMPKIIYPAVPLTKYTTRWENKKNRFICLGRISPEKKIEDIICILNAVRKQGHFIQLHIIGKFDTSTYSKYIKQLCDKHKSWIITEDELTGDKKLKFLSESKYGINACQREAFGISTAEMVQAGMLPFIPAQGAQDEIVPIEELIFNNKEDAQRKIIQILSNPNIQIELGNRLKTESPDFDPMNFCNEVRTFVEFVIKSLPN